MANAAMLADINVLFVPPNLDIIDPQAFTPGLSVQQAIAALGLEGVAFVSEYVAAMPKPIIDGMMGAIHAALTHEPRSTVTVAWLEAAKHGLTVSQGPAAFDTGRGAVNILLTGPLPQ
jgi:hypothetical protein